MQSKQTELLSHGESILWAKWGMRLASGEVYAWGQGFFGELANGQGGYDKQLRKVRAKSPQLIKSLSDVAFIAEGTGNITLAKLKDGRVMAWGSNIYAGLGVGPGKVKKPPQGETANQSDYWKSGTATPIEVAGLSKVSKIRGYAAVITGQS